MGRPSRCAVAVAALFVPVSGSDVAEVKIDMTAVNEVDERFVSWNIDLSKDRQFFDLDFGESRLRKLGAALAPAFLRVGGTGGDYLSYAVGGSTGCERFTGPDWQCMEEDRFRALCAFASQADVQMVFGLNIRHRRKDGSYDPSNAQELLSFARSIDCPIFGVELGNEQDKAMTAQAQAESATALYAMLRQVFPEEGQRPRLLGPDPHSFHTASDVAGHGGLHVVHYMGNLSAAGTPQYAATHHEYIEVGAEDNTSFYNASYLQRAADISKNMAAAVRAEKAREGRKPSDGPQLWGGEIGPHNGGSPPCDASSERWSNFANGFWYLQNLGSKANSGYSVMCRQDLVGADYGLLDCASHLPNPDFYTALLWKRIMGTRVLTALPSGSPSTSQELVSFAHCSKQGSGGVAVVILNLADRPLQVKVTVCGDILPGDRSEYHLTATGGLLGQGLALNGRELRLGEGDELPDLSGSAVVGTEPLVLAARSYAFVDFPGANAAACRGADDSIVI